MSGAENLGSNVAGYEQRLEIFDDTRAWGVNLEGYNPHDYTSIDVLTTGVLQGWSDPENPAEVDFAERPSYEGDLQFDTAGRPLNPHGRQGLAGRGDLGKWGVNNAADPVVIAVRNGKRRILLIERKDTHEWALPGGMVDPGEAVSATARRELLEEAGVDLAEVPGTEIYAGYVNDPRNTDNSWMETNATLFTIDYEPHPTAGDDAAKARWFDLNTIAGLSEQTGGLYASHAQIIESALTRIREAQAQA